MSVITFDFAKVRRDREEYLIALADAIRETMANDDPISCGPLTAADLLDCEAELQTENGETLLVSYRFAVGALCGEPGQIIDINYYADPACHARALQWANRYLAEVNASFGINLGRINS